MPAEESPKEMWVMNPWKHQDFEASGKASGIGKHGLKWRKYWNFIYWQEAVFPVPSNSVIAPFPTFQHIPRKNKVHSLHKLNWRRSGFRYTRGGGYRDEISGWQKNQMKVCISMENTLSIIFSTTFRKKKPNNLSIDYQTRIKIFSDMQRLNIFTPIYLFLESYWSVCTSKISLSPRRWKAWGPRSSWFNIGLRWK